MSDDKNLDVSRVYYVRTHAPALVAAMIVSLDPEHGGNWEWVRKTAIEQAGLLFDETETE